MISEAALEEHALVCSNRPYVVDPNLPKKKRVQKKKKKSTPLQDMTKKSKREQNLENVSQILVFSHFSTIIILLKYLILM